MMDLRFHIVRVQNGDRFGTGFFVNTEGYILTCAHVIKMPKKKIEITMCDYNGNFNITIPVRCIAYIPLEQGDIALLKAEIENRAFSLDFISSKKCVDNKFKVFGFPESTKPDNGSTAVGTITGHTNSENGIYPLLNIHSNDLKNGYSGAPIYDDDFEGVVGMVHAKPSGENEHRELFTNFAIPSDFIFTQIEQYIPSFKLLPSKEKAWRKYDKYHLNKYNEDDPFNSDDEIKIKFSDLYIDPFFKISSNAFEKKEDSKNQIQDFQYFQNHLTESILDIIDGNNPCNCKKDFGKPSLILILGHPGQGKSSFCRRLLHDFTKQLDLLDTSPLFLRLRDISKTDNLLYSPLNIFKDEFETDFYRVTNEKKEIEINNHRLIVLDGLDELQMVKEGKFGDESGKELCIKLVHELYRFSSDKRPTMIVTSRHGKVNASDFEKENILVIQLAELTLEQQQEWLVKFQGKQGKSKLSFENLKEFNQLKKFKHIKELIEQPILLNMVAKIEEIPNENSSRTQLYDRLFNLVINRAYDRNQKLNVHQKLDLNEKDLREFIRLAAMSVFMNGHEYVHYEQLAQDLKNASNEKIRSLFDNKHDNKDSLQQLRGLMMSFYLQEKTKDKDDNFKGKQKDSDFAIEFVHKSLMEFMVAEHCYSTLKEKILDVNRKGDFIIQKADECLKILSELFAKKKLSSDISEYIVELIREDKIEERIRLGKRLWCFFDELMGVNFLYKWDLTNNEGITPPINQALNTFWGYWLIFSFCKDDSLTYQIIDENDLFPFYIDNCPRTLLNLTNLDLMFVNMYRNKIYYFANFENSNFRHNHLAKTEFQGANLYNTNFENANLEGANFSNLHIDYNSGDDIRRKIQLNRTKLSLK